MDVVPGTYYAKAVAWAQRKGIVAGYGNGMYGPEDSFTREQLVTLLCNMQVYLSPTSQSLLFSRIPGKYLHMP